MAAPAILQVKGNKTFAPFSNLTSEQGLVQIWQAVSRASAFLEQGKRLENLSWRLWSLQAGAQQSDEVAVLNRGRLAGHILNRDKGAPVLLPPSGRPHKASCCKIDPSVPCVHKKQKTRGRPALAAGPSVPLRTPSAQSAESGSSTHNAFASTSKTTLAPSRSTNSQDQAFNPHTAEQQQQDHQSPHHQQQKSSQQPLWPISSISPNAHLAPSPFSHAGNNFNSLASLLGNASTLGTSALGNGGAVPSTAQLMLSALVDSLLSAGVAPTAAAHALTENPSHMLNTLQQQAQQVQYGNAQQMASSTASLDAHTLPSTPMDWSAPMPTNLEELTRASFAEMLGAALNGDAAVFGTALNGRGSSSSNLGVPNLNTNFQQQSSNMNWFGNQVDQHPQQSSSSAEPFKHHDVPMQDGTPIHSLSESFPAPSTSNEQHSPESPSSTSSLVLSRKSSNSGSTARRKQPKLSLERKLDRLRQQMPLGSPAMMSPSEIASPNQSEQSGPSSSAIDKDLPSAKSTSTFKTGKKKSTDVGPTGSNASASAKGKGKAKAVNDTRMFDTTEGGLAGRSKASDSSASQSRGPLQTTSSSARKAASTVASPAAPPDQAPPQCSNCGVKKTPLWRRCGELHELLCNACGLYWAMHKSHRPDKLKHNRSIRHAGVNGEDDDSLIDGSGLGTGNISDDDGPETSCSNCGTSTTPLWRKDREGNTVCNACGLFMKLHGSARPVKMRADIIKKRVRYENPMSPTGGMGGAASSHTAGSSDHGSSPMSGAGGAMSGASRSMVGTGLATTAPRNDGNSMDLDVALAQLHSSGDGFGASPSAETPSFTSTPSLMGAFSSTGNMPNAGAQNSVSFAPFHPGNDTAGRLTTTAASSSGFGSQHQQQSEDPTSAAARQRREQEQWAQAAGFLLPNEPMGDGFNFGQALWGCDPSVIGNWHPESSPSSCAAATAAALGLSTDPLANATHNHGTPAGASANTPMSVSGAGSTLADGASAGFAMSRAANSTSSIGMLRNSAPTGSQHASAVSSPSVSHATNPGAVHNEPAAVLFPTLFDLVTGVNDMDQGTSRAADGSAAAQLGLGTAAPATQQNGSGNQDGGDESATASTGLCPMQHSVSTPSLLRTPSSMGATGSPPV
ncbi:hypothetical protein OC845_001495 [Tilletia horrida]|nr:hypothetical protein OC845_001495 [Tilletia horrida]